ncbi:MAG: outer membrane lipoprotein-sorting protein [Bacteroidetes bacterium]|nr:MAG: outer membrane lipoprotein-sorting protein [Bacteroidota bacterium]
MKSFKASLILVLAFLGMAHVAFAQDTPDPKQIIQKVQDQTRGTSNEGEIKMTIIRPTWQREMRLKVWSLGTDYSLILITAPPRDKGTAFLKRKRELWNWQPSIDRVIKMPPSMMTQSWMGSDFSNDDMVQQADPVEDFTHKIIGSEAIEGRDCQVIEMIPKEDTPVAWGKIKTWVDKENFLELKTEFYDEDGYLVNTMVGKNIREMDGHLLATTLEVIPADEPGNKTIVEQLWIKFDVPLKASFFSVQNMKKVR